MSLPAPADLGAPVRFDTWRQHQPAAVLAIADSATRFVGCVLPTGAGKSLTVIGASLLAGWRTCVLTSTKLLQDQYLSDMRDAGMVDVRGQGSYECVAFHDEHHTLRDRSFHGCDEGPCRAGLPCSRKPNPIEEPRLTGCLSYDALYEASRAPLVVTNYKFWLHARTSGVKLGRFDCLVLDEAHHAPAELGDFLSTVIETSDMERLGSGGPCDDSHGAWMVWAKGQAARLADRLDHRPRDRRELREHKALRSTARKLETIAAMAEGDWLIQRNGHSVHFDPVWVKAHTNALFGHIPHIVCTSATFTRKTAEMLGISDTNLTWHEAPSDFPVDRRPVVYVPCVKVDYRADESQIRLWLATIDNVLRRRRDRKGIIHAVSYERAKLIERYSEFRDSMILHSRQETREAVERFRAADPGAILVSPSVSTGYDFADDTCRFQILVKVPFPDRRNPITAARTAVDAEYPSYLAMQEMVQAVGRGMRSASDWCESIILDSNFTWWWPRNRPLAPTWFQDALEFASTLPEPLCPR